MKGKPYKKGDIIVLQLNIAKHSFSVSDSGVNTYAIIEFIQDIETGEKYSQYDIITGWGDENSKVEIACKIINEDFKLEQQIKYFDAHKVVLVEDHIKDQIVKYTNFIEIYRKLLLVGDEKELLNRKLKKLKTT